MTKRPLILDVFAVFLFFVAVAFPIQIMWIYGHGFSEMASVFAKLSVLNFAVILGATANAYFIYKASPVLKYSIPALIVLVGLNNYTVGYVGTDYSLWTTSLATFAFSACHLVICQPRLLQLVRHPERRWWLRAKRHRVEAALIVSPYNGALFSTKTFEISEGGAFIATDENVKLNVNDKINVCLTLGAMRQIRCEARVVRKALHKGIYPSGIGISFENIDSGLKRNLKRYLSHQPIIETVL